jgi:multiple sugar transport system ATP-binding protein
VTSRLSADTQARAGEALEFGFDLSKASYFAPETGERLA